MAKMQKGSLVLLKIGNGATPTESFTTVGGLRTTQLKIERALVSDADVESGAWRSAMSGAGLSNMRLRGVGVYSDEASHDALLTKALSGAAANYGFYFANGDVMKGAFVMTAYERGGGVKDAESFSVTLDSAGTPVFTAAS